MTSDKIEFFLKKYFANRPLFLSLIRAKEAALFHEYLASQGETLQGWKRPVMDVGCGDGFFARMILEGSGVKKVRPFPRPFPTSSDLKPVKPIDVGLDVKGSRMEEARTLGIYKKLETYDGVHIAYGNSAFGTIFSNCVLEHVEKLPELLKEIHRILAPGGVFITTVMAKPWEDNLVGSMMLGNWYKSWMRKKQIHVNLLTKRQWDRAFVRAGMRPEQTVGYLSVKACRLIDFCHYLSIPSLMSYLLFRKWVLFPRMTWYPIRWLASVLSEPVTVDSSGALFYVLRKKSGLYS